MSLNPGGNQSYGWNYSRQDRDGYSLELYGTIVSLQEVQAREFNMGGNQPGRPRFWPDGNPIMNIRVGLATPDGSLKSITMGKAGKKQISGEKPSLHMQLFNLTHGNMMELIGKTIHIWTWPSNPNTGQMWGQGNPRLFGVEEVTDGTKYELAMPLPPEFEVPELLCNDGAQGGQPTPPSPQQMYQMPPMQNGYYMPPQPQYQQPQYQPVQQQPQYPQYQPVQPTVTHAMPAMQAMPPMSAPMPGGMDPAVAQAMQAIGATNMQPVSGNGAEIYDDGMPF
jgi:hypothetical protein